VIGSSREVPVVLLTCPTCRSGLEVPDGTTAMVRCPACKTVFSAADSEAPEEEEKPRTKVRRPARQEEDEDEKPRRKSKKEDEKPKEENRDFDPLTEEEEKKLKRKKRRREADDELSAEEKAARRAAFQRAAWGARLIWISFSLFMLSMTLIAIYFFQFGLAFLRTPSPAFIVAAGIVGMVNWVMAAVGVGLCLSGPRAPGHWGYGIAAAVTTVIHFIFLLALVSQNREYSVGREVDKAMGESSYARWSMLATRLDTTMFYMTAVIYTNEQGATPKDPMTLSMITGVMEMVRTMFIMMLLSCLARAALDEEVAHKCTRTAGIVSGGPAMVALLMLVFIAFVIETGAGLNLFTIILFTMVNMGVYAILMGVMLPAFMAARDVDDACEEPFQSLIPHL
jgi:LSD1 subclass zinc finger protein